MMRVLFLMLWTLIVGEGSFAFALVFRGWANLQRKRIVVGWFIVVF